ncbi:MAG: type II secretion system protein [Trueperaceae bacterium]|nr:type II secretion system protein [Trueperaceae bacterium]
MSVHGARRSSQGVTLIELLVALAIMGVLLAALASILNTTNTAYRTHARAVDQSEVRFLVTQILRYHVRLAGYVGSTGEQVNTVCGRSVEATKGSGSGSDALTIRYFEDRRYEADEPTNSTLCSNGDSVTHITFSASDGFFTQDGEAVVEGVTGFEVEEFVASSDEAIAPFEVSAEQLGQLTGVRIGVQFEEAAPLNLTIPFANRQNDFFGSVVEEETN